MCETGVKFVWWTDGDLHWSLYYWLAWHSLNISDVLDT